MKFFVYKAILFTVFSFSLTTLSLGQPEEILFSLGINGGVNYPINQFAKETQTNQYGGKITRAGMGNVYLSYHLSKDYRITGSFYVSSLQSREIMEKLDARYSSYNAIARNAFNSATLNFGLQKNIYINGRNEFCLFIRPELGLQLNNTIYDLRTYYSNSLMDNIIFEDDKHWSPSFALSSGFEFTIFRHFLLNIMGQYAVSNFGTEDIYGTTSFNQTRTALLPDVEMGWVHRFSAGLGIGINLLRAC